ncbi:hypothetical protein AB0L68_31635, partial [Streptomyces sp. NPDC052164]
ITVGEVEYIASQPWPFPSSLMLGFMARAVPRPGYRPFDITAAVNQPELPRTAFSSCAPV